MDGILIIDKFKGPTSHDIIDFLRRRFSIRKTGHAGTLDPQASGVLVVLVGSYTKKSKEFSGHDKEYEACLTLGIATDSQDANGRILKKEKYPDYNLRDIEGVFGQFLGEIEQIPPMFSALKYKGRRLYMLARKGIEVRRPARQVYIHSLKITKFELPHIHFVVRCSKGTYIRTLCADIARALGCPGHLSELRRIRSGPFTISQAISLDQLNNFSAQKLEEALLTIGC